MKLNTTPNTTIHSSAAAILAALALLAAAPRAPAQTGWGGALSFDGVDDHMVVTNFGNAVPTNEVTVEFWLRPAVTNKVQTVFRLEPDEGANRFMFDLRPDGSVIWDFGNSGTGGRLWSAPSLTVTGAWQHFALVAKVGAANYMAIYRNGVLITNQSGADAFAAGTYDLVLGYRFAAPNAYYLSGELDEFRIWNRARTQAEIQADLHHPLTGAESNLVAYWKFDEGAGTTAYDSTTNHFDAMLTADASWVASTVSVPSLRFKVLTYNTHLFEDSTVECLCKCGAWVNQCDWSTYQCEDGQRIDSIVAKVKASGADIVALQEVWAPAKQIDMVQKLADTYPYAKRYDPPCDCRASWPWYLQTCCQFAGKTSQGVAGQNRPLLR